MDRLTATSTTQKHPLPPHSIRTPHLNRETLRQIGLSAAALDTTRASLTAKCVTFNADAIRGTNDA